MFTDMYNTFDNKCIPYNYPFSFQKNQQQYIAGNEPTYEMDYGDTAVFPFFIAENYRDYLINIIIYNFRGEKIYEYSGQPEADGHIRLVIDGDTSVSTFKKGIYSCQLQAVRITNDFEDTCTLIPAAECSIYVR